MTFRETCDRVRFYATQMKAVMSLKILLAILLGSSIVGRTQPTPDVAQSDGAFLRLANIGNGAIVLEAVVKTYRLRELLRATSQKAVESCNAGAIPM